MRCQTTFQITGMTCVTCTGTVENSLVGVWGVFKASVNLATAKAKGD